jgi:adenylate cyclase
MAEDEELQGRARRLAAALGKFDSRPSLVKGAKALRKLLPGDPEHGDPLSVAGNEPANLIGQRIAQVTAQRPSALREVGFGALQMWQALSEAQGRGRGNKEMAIVFTDLVEFSDWALEAGDTKAVDLLRKVGKQIEPPLESHDGTIVKRLGDGLMAVFEDPADALAAACEASNAMGGIEADGYRPQLRAGIHLGKPRALGGDYFGVDVNIAARVAEAAGPGEVLISDAAHKRIQGGDVELRRKWSFKAKGAPDDLTVYAARLDG